MAQTCPCRAHPSSAASARRAGGAGKLLPTLGQAGAEAPVTPQGPALCSSTYRTRCRIHPGSRAQPSRCLSLLLGEQSRAGKLRAGAGMDFSNQVERVWGWFCCCFFFSPGKTLMCQNKVFLQECASFSLTLLRNFCSKLRSKRALLSRPVPSCPVPSHPIPSHPCCPASRAPHELPAPQGHRAGGARTSPARAGALPALPAARLPGHGAGGRRRVALSRCGFE